MKRKNKKKGVTLVFLLAMAMIITIIGGVLIRINILYKKFK